MSYCECLQIYHPVDPATYLKTLKQHFGARPHPNEPRAYVVGKPPLPFYDPQTIDDHLSILSFNYWPLASELVQALIAPIELAPPSTPVRWTAEQELIFAGTLARLAEHI